MAHFVRDRLRGPITVTQFLQNFQQAWRSNPRFERQMPRRLGNSQILNSVARSHELTLSGIAVSGGADSMALTVLCKQLEKSKLLHDMYIKGFIVDHKAREESSREAERVAGWLKQLGINLACFLDALMC